MPYVYDSPSKQKGLLDVLNYCIYEESKYLRINGISKAMNYQGIRFVIRDLGISIVKSDTLFNTLETRLNETFMNLGELHLIDNLNVNAIR